MSKTYVLDTNVLLDDPNAIYSFAKNDVVVIPYAVVEELERHKHNSNDDLNKKARICSKNLLNIFSSAGNKKEAVLENGTILRMINHSNHVAEKHGLDCNLGDDKILATAIAVNSANRHNEQDENVTIVSEDVILKLRAINFGLEAKSHNEFDFDPNKNENLPTSLDGLYSGYRKLEVEDDILSDFWTTFEPPKTFDDDGDLVSAKPSEYFEPSAENIFEDQKLLPNEFVVLGDGKSSKQKRPWAVLRKIGGQKQLKFVREKSLDKIKPLNVEQFMAVELLMDPKVNLVTLMGQAGTGKTILALEAGLNQVLTHKKYNNIIIIRPIHPVGKDIGFLPGTREEKLEPWVAPIKDNLRVLLSPDGKRTKQSEKTLELLFENGTIEIEALTYVRGRSLDNAFIIVDEGQNLNRHELKTILTRVGKGTKVVITGDIEQTDRSDVNAFNNGLSVAIEKFKPYAIVGHVTLKEGVRSELSELAAKIL